MSNQDTAIASIGTREFNFDGLVGPSHNFAGLSSGNMASIGNATLVANPRQAALQGLAKMRALADRGFAQAVLPPQMRPNVGWLREIGFLGSDAAIIARAAREAPILLAAAYSASPMWTANAATVSPSSDTADRRVHFTVANLNAKAHRAHEQVQTLRVFRSIFSDPSHFAVHAALPSTPAFGDEGAANHGRLCTSHAQEGVEMFVFGRSAFDSALPKPKRYEARQTLEAGHAIARLHGLSPQCTVHLQQNPAAIDNGVFHNDVIAVANGPVLFYHEQAFLDPHHALAALRHATDLQQMPFQSVCIPASTITIEEAVGSYLFNSQLLSRDGQKMTLVVPQECRENARVDRFLGDLASSGGPIDEVVSFDLRESMRNGGGPACLRLRVVLTEDEIHAMHGGIVLTDLLAQRLDAWIRHHYRDRLAPHDLADPQLAEENRTAMTALGVILGLPDLYSIDRVDDNRESDAAGASS